MVRLAVRQKGQIYVQEVEVQEGTPLNEIEKAANAWCQAAKNAKWCQAENDGNTLKNAAMAKWVNRRRHQHEATPTLLDTTILECINGKWCNVELDRKVDMYLEAVENSITSETALYEIIDAANAWFQSHLPANGTKRNESKTTSLFPKHTLI
jgi:hypothetical protein